MNKFKTQEKICYTFISMWVIGIILVMITSCNTLQTTNKVTMDKNGIYHQPHQYESWNIK
jgi:hypothetical protein